MSVLELSPDLCNNIQSLEVRNYKKSCLQFYSSYWEEKKDPLNLLQEMRNAGVEAARNIKSVTATKTTNTIICSVKDN